MGIPAVHEGAEEGAVSVSWFYGADQSFEGVDKVEFPIEGGTVKLKNVDKRSPSLKKRGVRFHPIVRVKIFKVVRVCICPSVLRHSSSWVLRRYTLCATH